ncbi:MAG TPA: asparaginase [Geminicoccus sp.]|jgi:L-asparaginase II|uniref:asparaginase n=1 Tax=Geminicoccus sp. TaxID=2024832 RepID=UPI002E3068A4|nr:asparaginase [Geminicoccus sp.]HEX2529086.1 asparaginase [Geminicoccus sp.]
MDPIAVLVTRGRHIESRHTGRLVVCDAEGHARFAIGDVTEPVFPRSAIKPFQALPLVETGAFDRFVGDPADLALACASHNGEAVHVDRVLAWLERAGLRETDLRCGGHPPLFGPAEVERIEQHRPIRPAFNNCSGKHTGMLTVASLLGAPLETYLDRGHPVQQRVEEALCALTGLDDLPEPGLDGCGVPSWPIPLDALARAGARLAAPQGQSPSRQAALGRIAGAMVAHPEMVAGTGRLCTALMRAAPWIVAKTGAEGVYLAGHRRLGLGLALKATDGATRAAEAMLLAALDRMGWLDGADRAALHPFGEKPIRNVVGTEVGAIRVEENFLKGLA